MTTSTATPPEGSRYRCGACGNLTRFDVVSTRRSSKFLHFDLAGDATVEEEQVLDEQVERITCRWCGSSDQIEVVPKVSAE